MYQLKNFDKSILPRRYYQQELQKVQFPDVFLVKEILKQKGNMYQVAWLGDQYRGIKSWIKKSDLIHAEG